MIPDRIRGKTLRFSFRDGPMAGRTVEHAFGASGDVTWRVLESGGGAGKPTRAKKCEIASISDDVSAIAYLSDSGYTLTLVLDFRTGELVAFSSNEKELGMQHGTFEPDDDAAAPARRGEGGEATSVH